MKDEQQQDDAIRGLAETLREMICVANDSPDLLTIDGTENVIEAIGRASLQVSSVIDEYARLPFIGEAVYKWLDAPDPSANHDNARKEHKAGTCSWFLTGAQYMEWKHRGDSYLWVYGIPGCGKTILCSTAIEDVADYCRGDPSRAFAYFYFDSRDSQEQLQLHEGLIRSLIKQLLVQCRIIPDELDAMCVSGRRHLSADMLRTALSLALKNFQDVYLLVDSMDECSEMKELLGWIKEIKGSKTGNLHLLATSRPEHIIKECMESLEIGQVCLEGDDVNRDIESYVDDLLQESEKLKKWSEEIRQKLMTNAAGMFRLISLQLRELQTCRTQQQMKRQLDTLPKDLFGIYERVLSRLGDRDRQDALKILQWLAYSARPLQLDELSEVFSIDFDALDGPRFDADCRYTDPKEIFDHVCPSSLATESEGIVKLAHLTVKEFLVSMPEASPFYISASAAHSLISKTCLVYLMKIGTLDTIDDATTAEYPLIEYAAQHWPFHVHAQTDGELGDLQNLLLQLFQTDAALAAWISHSDSDESSFLIPGDPQELPEPLASALYYASSTGLQRTSLTLMELGADPNAQGGYCGNALQAACEGGHKAVVKLLLEKGADPNAKGGGYGTALQAACFHNFEEIVKLLLDSGAIANPRALETSAYRGSEANVKLLLAKGADPNTRVAESLYGHALHAACAEDFEPVVKLLLENGADPNATGGTALEAACCIGSEPIVRLLLAKGADPNVHVATVYDNALQAATVHGSVAVVRLLLENGADPNLQGGEFGHALQAACFHSFEAIVRLLLEHGADPMAMGGTALETASFMGSIANVRLLLAKGADPNARVNTDYEYALQAASVNGHAAIVKLLLEKGADPNARGEAYGTALEVACMNGHVVVVRTLLEGGANPDAQGGMFGTTLQAASWGGSEDLVALLLERGAGPNVLEGSYGSALLAAVWRRSETLVDMLLAKGADLASQGGDALEAASWKGFLPLVTMLLDRGVDPNTRGGYYGNALQAASAMGHEAIVELLLDRGADPNEEGTYGTAYQAASKTGHQSIAQLLLEHSATRPNIAVLESHQ
ncbi:hypothetical protein HETIRDRAFT_455819 [Heterobasidion irregulare TC 32-1]|uniref:Uncharacterized protein n=1 Tax=Heterobasidion irregulare (strain TC 32-1) TaxID=747525 RepID=W4JNL4_HETIT|nr:uncharacterized protein HETIRDRAFT_455819 [Heterobasidion irregulare TC 32-1]ETW75133.1 hypothetical protein HETIRDRAFT_455819 [Heterobasidion irregulare TC 32-1]